MAKATGPLMSQSAHGQLGKTINFSSWKEKTRIKLNATPKNPKSEDQKKQRGYLNDAVTAWHTLTKEDKAMWEGWR